MIKTAVRRLLRIAGYELHQINRLNSPSRRLALSMAFHGIDLVFDVGANAGQFGAALRQAGFAGRIESFEPLSAAHAALAVRAKNDVLWKVHDRMALGERNSEVMINIASNSVSSSVLKMADAHLAAARGSKYIASETTAVRTLDSLVGSSLRRDSRPLLKIDTQGYEWMVLDGAESTLPMLQGIHIEASLVELYVGQRLWLDVKDRLECAGFSLWSIERGFTDPNSGRMLQCDLTFYRTLSPRPIVT